MVNTSVCLFVTLWGGNTGVHVALHVGHVETSVATWIRGWVDFLVLKKNLDHEKYLQ